MEWWARQTFIFLSYLSLFRAIIILWLQKWIVYKKFKAAEVFKLLPEYIRYTFYGIGKVLRPPWNRRRLCKWIMMMSKAFCQRHRWNFPFTSNSKAIYRTAKPHVDKILILFRSIHVVIVFFFTRFVTLKELNSLNYSFHMSSTCESFQVILNLDVNHSRSERRPSCIVS